MNFLGEYSVPAVIDTDHLCSYRASTWEIQSLVNIDHQQVTRAACFNNLIEY